MKFLFVTLVGICAVVEVLSITCYRCGGGSPSGVCSSSNNATVECADQPNAVYACQVYTVNFTTLGQVQDFKSCCLYEDCNKNNPCELLGKGTVCSKMASCQSDKCNYDYATAKASQPPTLPSKACKVFFSRFVVALAALVVFYFSI